MRRTRARDRGILQASEGTAAIEFAVILPILLFMTLAGGQVLLYINATRKVERIANGIATMISEATPPSSSTTIASVNATDLNFSYDSTMVQFPYVLSDAIRKGVSWRSNITVSYASVAFNQTSSTCSGQADQSPCYTPTVVWTSTGTSSNSYRPCSQTQTAVDDGAPPSRSTLPRSVFGPGSIIAVDVSFTFAPTFGSGLVSATTITRSAFVQPRYASQINFDPTGNDGIASSC